MPTTLERGASRAPDATGARQAARRAMPAAGVRSEGTPAPAGCPVHGPAAARRSQPPGEPIRLGTPDFERISSDTVVVRSAALARAVLRAGDVAVQDGFRVRDIAKSPVKLRSPVLFQDGEEHRAQRTAIARFFTPKAAKENYRPVMEALTAELMAELRSKGRADLAQMAMRLAVSVAAQVVGLTNSREPGMHARLDAFLSKGTATFSWRPDKLIAFLRLQSAVMRFFRVDVKPAIDARRQHPKDDVISHLISQDVKDRDILIEAITYGAAGMVTTREFISIAAWHLLDDDELRRRYLAGDEEERQRLLAEVVRVEPVVGHLQRRLTGQLELSTEAGPVTLPAGTVIDIDVRAANFDPAAVGEHPACLAPEREIKAKGVQPFALSFGDGHHRCPGSYLALEEADVFLHELMAIEGLRIERPPTVTYNDLVKGYELRDFVLRID